jgi:hypothetical protein
MTKGQKIPSRDYYTGEVASDDGAYEERFDAGLIDVAMSTGYHNKVRLSIDNAGARGGVVLMDADELEELIGVLTRALGFARREGA